MKRVMMAMAVAFWLGQGNAQAATILFDSFDTENGGVGVLNYSGFANFSIGNGTVDLIGNGFFDFLPGNGLYVDLDGSTSDAGIQTADPRVLGAGSYTLSFDLAGSRRGGSPVDNVAILVFGSSTNYGSLNLVLPNTQAFTSYTIPFTLSGSDTISFSFSNAGSDNMGALLDNVQLSSVPEPGSAVLLAIAALGAAARRRRRK